MKLVGGKYDLEPHKSGINKSQIYSHPLEAISNQPELIHRAKYNDGSALFNITVTLTEKGQRVIDALRQLICIEFNITHEELKGGGRYMPLPKARGAFTSILRSNFSFPLKLIGTYLGGRDHSSILMAERRAKEFYKRNGTYHSSYDNVEKSFMKFLKENNYIIENTGNNGFNDIGFA